MGNVYRLRRYDFRSARSRIIELTLLYRIAKRRRDDLACWALAAEIEELEKEIQEAHQAKEKQPSCQTTA